MIVSTIRNGLSDAWPMLAISLSIVILVRITYLIYNHKKFVLFQELGNLFFLIYILMLFEFLTSTETGNYGSNYIPFREITRYPFGSNLFIYNVLGNIILFVPFGFFICSYGKIKKITPIIIVSALTSAIVELVQLKIGRAFDVDDIILNVLGAILGYLLYIGFDAIKSHLPAIFRKDGFYNIVAVLFFLACVYLFYHYIGFGWF